MASKRGSRSPPFDFTQVAVELQKGLSTLHDDDVCTDFEIIVGEESFRCHKVVLASVSDYFKAMFSSGMKETIQNKATFQDLNPNTLEIIFDILYPKSDVPNPLVHKSDEEMSELLRVGEMLQMKIVTNVCLKYFERTLSAVNCIDRWKIGNSLLCHKLTLMSWRYLMANFDTIAHDELLLTLDINEFTEIIQDESLFVKSEELVWRTIRRWLQFDENTRANEVDKLLRHCCLTEIDKDYLIEEIAFDPFVRQSEISCRRIKNAYKYHRHHEIHGNMELKFRLCMGKEQVVVLLGNRERNGSKAGTMTLMYRSERQDKWTTLQQSYDATEEFAFCVHGGSIFISGGSLHGGVMMQEYSIEDDKWEKRQKMIVPLRRHTMVAENSCLYVVGGLSYNATNGQVLQYCIGSDSWHLEGEIVAPVSDASSVFLDNKIYIFGGSLQEDKPADSVQMYDVRTKQATIVCHLPEPCSFSCALNWNEDIYIVISHGDVIQFVPDKHDVESIVSIPDFKRTKFGIAVNQDNLFIYGGVIDGKKQQVTSNDVFAVNLASKDVAKATKPSIQLRVGGVRLWTFGNTPVTLPCDGVYDGLAMRFLIKMSSCRPDTTRYL